jgi:uncharacterized damage-inducible protein DinB
MKTKLLAIALFIIMVSNTAKAQVKVTDIAKEWERSKVYTKEYLDAMSESGYALKPTAEMRSFAEQMLHLSDANYGLGSLAMGIKSPFNPGQLEKTSEKSKGNVTKVVMASYDFMIENIKKMPQAQLNEIVKLFDQFEMSREIALSKVLEHQAHHRGQTTVYLRLAKVTPPQEKLF